MDVDYSVVIPAYNEEELLGETLSKLREAMESVELRGEIIVTDNNSTDRTGEVAREAGARVVFEPFNQISRARNAGAAVAGGRYLVFVDGDTLVPPELLRTALENLESGRFTGGGATLSVGMDELPVMVRGGIGFWNLVSRTFDLAAGCFVYVRRDDFEACGGFSEKLYASEEVWLSRSLKRFGAKRGRKFEVHTAPRVLTSDRKLGWHGTLYQLGLMLMLAFLPFMTRFKWACNYWYKRPQH